MGRYNWEVARIRRSGIKVVVITQALKEFYISRGVPANHILVAHDAVNLEEFDTDVSQEEARRLLGLPLDKKIVMYIGALKEWKGYRTLLEASYDLPGDVQVVIIGGGTKVVKDLQDAYPRVTFLGSRPYRDLPVNQKAADVLVIPNTNTNDPFERFTSPLKVFAHMASGVPMVVSDVPPLREVLSERTALLYEPGNSADLAAKIHEVLESPDKAAQRAERARVEVEEYTWDKRAHAILHNFSC